MKRNYFHGTTEEHARNILSGGKKLSGTWMVSDSDGFLYLWGSEEVAEADGQQDEEQEFKDNDAQQRAIESALLTCAVSPDAPEKIVVLQFSIDSEEVEEDLSCEEMLSSGAVRVRPDEAAKGFVKAWHIPYKAEFTPFVLSSIIYNEKLCTYNVDEDILELARYLSDDGGFIPEKINDMFDSSNLQEMTLCKF